MTARLTTAALLVLGLATALPVRAQVATPARTQIAAALLEPVGTPVDSRDAVPSAQPVGGGPIGGGGTSADCLLFNPSTDRRTVSSTVCLSCHTSGSGAFEHGGHPVGMTYVTYGKDLRQDPQAFNAAVILQANNTVACLTCHDPRSQLVQHLAAPTGGEVAKRLCVACHPH
ncbi:MAG: hypothetical protein U0229_02705 [Anaeromyxobacter sp.]